MRIMMIKLRELRPEDAPLMLEWMHDQDTQKSFKKDMLSTSLEQAIEFCEDAVIPDVIHTGDNLHFAIVDDKDEYLGTISLKNMDLDSLMAEYAITTRKKARGKGVGFTATGILLKKAFKEYGLHRVYLNVFSDNAAAIKMYERCGFHFEGEFRDHIMRDGEYVNWKWFGMLENEFDEQIFARRLCPKIS